MHSPAGDPGQASSREPAARVLGNKHASAPLCKRAVCLKTVFFQQNAAYFHGLVSACIAFGAAAPPPPGRRRRRSIVLGSYCARRGRIRIHPALAEPSVPTYVVVAVVFHEMLHAYLGTDEVCARTGRRRVHTAEFRAIERSHPSFAAAVAWERAHLAWLLGWRRPSAASSLHRPCLC